MAPSIELQANSDLSRSYADDRDHTSEQTIYTTSNGAPVPHPYESQRAGNNGPLLLQDFHLIDLLSHFDRERIPERVVHAKGSGALGVYRSIEGCEDICMADIFKPGTECPIVVRWSTVGGEKASLYVQLHKLAAPFTDLSCRDLARDPRGFSVKFKTSEGNWDVVANNTPVFFLRDPAKFPHFIHTQKRHPATNLTHMDDSTAFWDYFSQNPESVHQMMILMGDRGIPDGYRFMHGYLGHAMKFINKDNEWVYVQVHFKSKQGIKFFTQKEAADKGADYSQQDLYEAIKRGDHPAWDVCIQTMTPKQAEEAWEQDGINVFDLTHIWPQGKYKLRKIGEFVVNENVKNYFAEVESVAFSPSHLVPGIEPSADPVLQSRLFSYPDTHRHRIGTNYNQLPINQPLVPYSMGNFQRDGHMAFYNQGERPNYLASTEPIQFKKRVMDLDKIHGQFIGNAVTFLSEIRPEDFNAPRALWERVFDESARERWIENVSTHMENIKINREEIIKREIAILREVSEDCAARLEKATGIMGYPGIAGLTFNGTHNGMSKDASKKTANGQNLASVGNQGAPYAGTHDGMRN